MIIIKFLINLILIIFLTIISQIGGLVYLVFLLLRRITKKWTSNIKRKYALEFVSLSSFYLLMVFFVVPSLARSFGMVQLPCIEKNAIRPYSFISCLLNRNYVTIDLNQTLINVVNQLGEYYPDISVSYLDANFPFNTGLPLLPHLGHNDGKKLDISFFYKDNKTGEPIYRRPSLFGYGYVEGPQKNEINTILECEKKGNKMYSFSNKMPWISQKNRIQFDEKRTKVMIDLFSRQKSISKMFIEPHLKLRMKLNSSKIRFHGCNSVRHDDHLHIQIY